MLTMQMMADMWAKGQQKERRSIEQKEWMKRNSENLVKAVLCV